MRYASFFSSALQHFLTATLFSLRSAPCVSSFTAAPFSLRFALCALRHAFFAAALLMLCAFLLPAFLLKIKLF